MRVVRHPAQAGAETALAIGSFDGVHLGHAALLGRLANEARVRSLEPAVLTFEPLPREFFAPDRAPARLTSLRERLTELERHGARHAFVQRFDARFAAIEAADFERRLRSHYGARVLLVGEDFRYGAKRMGDTTRLTAAGRREGYDVLILPAVAQDGARVSSTRVREALAA